jgi:hypothetical protein
MPYMDEALAYGNALSNVLNPPDENLPVKATATAPPGLQQPGAAPVQSAPATPSVPATVTRSGNDKGATPGQPAQKSWADYVRQANDASLQNLSASSQAADQMRKNPTAANLNAPLEQQRNKLATPTPYRDPKTGEVVPGAEGYKPNAIQRVARGLAAARTGGLAGVLNPESVGATPYGAPNSRYGTVEANRQAQVASIDQQMKQNADNEKTENTRLKDVGTEERANATGYRDVAVSATGQQNAESREEIDAARAGEQNAKADAERSKLPTSYESTVVAAHMETDPARKKALTEAAQEMKSTELKKFTYAQRATGGSGPNGDLRQPMIDEATSKIQKLNDYQFDPEANNGNGGFYDPTSPKKVYTPQQFTDLKNQISTKLDADLARKKLRPLRVRFNTKDTTPGVDRTGQHHCLQARSQRSRLHSQRRHRRPVTPRSSSASQRPRSSPATRYFRKGDQTVVYRNGAYRDVPRPARK